MQTICKPQENKISSNQHKFVKSQARISCMSSTIEGRGLRQRAAEDSGAQLSSWRGLIQHWGKAKPVRWKSDVGCTKPIKSMAQIWSQEFTAQKQGKNEVGSALWFHYQPGWRKKEASWLSYWPHLPCRSIGWKTLGIKPKKWAGIQSTRKSREHKSRGSTTKGVSPWLCLWQPFPLKGREDAAPLPGWEHAKPSHRERFRLIWELFSPHILWSNKTEQCNKSIYSSQNKSGKLLNFLM